MKCRVLLGIALLLAFAGCGVYKELKPKPPISSLEGSYIELTKSKSEDKTELLELKQDKKYYARLRRLSEYVRRAAGSIADL